MSINLINENVTNNESFHFLQAGQESILKEIINLGNKKMELLEAFLLAVSRMCQICVTIFYQISGMRKLYLTKIFPKI